MDWINRYSSRRHKLDEVFLNKKLRNAKSYKRIAGYFRSSIFELVGEAIEHIPEVKIICNSELDVTDIAVSKYAREVALKERWNQVSPEVEALLNRERYRKLFELLTKGNIEIRVVPKDKIFIHGKAGVIELVDGTKTCFLGSINESKSAYAHNYEILWEDTSPEGIAWVEEEFEALWKDSYPLPDAIIEEIERISKRIEIRFDDITAKTIPQAAFAEAPIYRNGEQLQPWQRAFITMFLDHRETYGKVRLLLADEVGLGKTLSLATAGIVSVLLDDGPMLVLCPATLTLQWQTELMDKLGIPSAVWLSNKKTWLDYRGHEIKTRGAEDIVNCPMQIAIVSTGLIFHDSDERRHLLARRYGTVILDEAHRARRRGGLGYRENEPNNLLDFMIKIAPRTRHLLLGTATPIQTEVRELWDLLFILNEGADFVLGRVPFSKWSDVENALPIVKGEYIPQEESEAWELLKNPLPPAREHPVFSAVRSLLHMPDDRFFHDIGFSSLEYPIQQVISQTLDHSFFRENNPVVRHTVLRRRKTLEEAGLLERIAVNVHPNKDAAPGTYKGVHFEGIGLMTNHPFNLAYEAAEAFTEALKRRVQSPGFMKTLLLQRICSSFEAGRLTAERMLHRESIEGEENEEQIRYAIEHLTAEEQRYLEKIIEELSRPEARDPKVDAVKYFLTEHVTEGKTWSEHGCIVFSQYYDTVKFVAEKLTDLMPEEPIAVYAGAGKSGIYLSGGIASVEREEIKKAVLNNEIRILVATDAACEGLNLQRLGTLINIDLPWNPSRLEQRLGRIKRIGQKRLTVDMLNLVYHDTQDEKIYEVLSRRMKDRYDIFGSLPDVIEDEWIETIEMLEEMMDKYMHLRKNARDIFELRYEQEINPSIERWELCSQILSRRDINEKITKPW